MKISRGFSQTLQEYKFFYWYQTMCKMPVIKFIHTGILYDDCLFFLNHNGRFQNNGRFNGVRNQACFLTHF